tara:strand:- start:5669 stop:7375 length:1707 start_codon:yes stop_codon:yes gene_type:complete
MKKRRRLAVDQLEQRIVLSASPWQNPVDAMDINRDNHISPIDALLPINAMNTDGSSEMLLIGAPPILADMMADVESFYMDANGDGYLSPADALGVINLLAEGEYGDASAEELYRESHDVFPDSPDNAAQLDLDWGYAFIESEINNAYDVDAFQFVAEEDRVAIDLFNEGLDEGVVVELLNAEMELLARAETGEDYQWCGANIDVPVDIDSTYYVMVSALNTEDTGHYILDVFQYEDDWWEPATDSELGDDIHGDTPEQATQLPLEYGFDTINSHIDTAEDVDQFAVEIDNGQLSVSVYPNTTDNLLRLSITDTTGNLIGLTQGNGDGAWLELSVEAGTYYVAIDSLDSATTDYTLDVSYWSDEPWKFEADSKMGDDIHTEEIGPEATVLDHNDSLYVQRVSHIDFDGDIDVFQFEATESFASLSVYATDWESHTFPGLAVFDGQGNEIYPVLFSDYNEFFSPEDELYVRDQDIFALDIEDLDDEFADGDFVDNIYPYHEEAEFVVCWGWPGGMYHVETGETYFVAVDGGYGEDKDFTGQYSLELNHFTPEPYEPFYGEDMQATEDDNS